jgi:hypothetical protein
MPAIARFHGITIYIYLEVGHHMPHFHARYSGQQASFAVYPPVLLAGSLPRRQHNLVLAWAELHADELQENWRLIKDGQPPRTIEGL